MALKIYKVETIKYKGMNSKMCGGKMCQNSDKTEQEETWKA